MTDSRPCDLPLFISKLSECNQLNCLMLLLLILLVFKSP